MGLIGFLSQQVIADAHEYSVANAVDTAWTQEVHDIGAEVFAPTEMAGQPDLVLPNGSDFGPNATQPEPHRSQPYDPHEADFKKCYVGSFLGYY